MHSLADLKKLDDDSFNGVVGLDEPVLEDTYGMMPGFGKIDLQGSGRHLCRR